jgi:hypothetical protein
MKKYYLLIVILCSANALLAQIDPVLLRRTPKDTSGMQMNMDAIYNRPFLQMGKLPVAVGGYVEGNYQYLKEDGISEGHQFQMRRLTLFVSSSIYKRIKFLSEIEFEDGTKEINIEFASVDFEFSPLLNFRGGIVMTPNGSLLTGPFRPRRCCLLPGATSVLAFLERSIQRTGCMRMKPILQMASMTRSSIMQMAKHFCLRQN